MCRQNGWHNERHKMNTYTGAQVSIEEIVYIHYIGYGFQLDGFIDDENLTISGNFYETEEQAKYAHALAGDLLHVYRNEDVDGCVMVKMMEALAETPGRIEG